MSDSQIMDMFVEPIKKAIVPVSESIGNTLKDLWDLAFGRLGIYVEKKRLTRLKDLEDFQGTLYGDVAKIPEDRLQEPSLAIIGPAMESSKYYFEEPELREMFANLIAASFDTAYNDTIHPSFTAIIQQLSPLDAQNLMVIKGNLPIAEYREIRQDGSFEVLLTHVFLANTNVQDEMQQSRSISVLQRLGLVSVNYDVRLSTVSGYGEFSKTPMFQNLSSNPKENTKVTIREGVISLTPLGQAFKDVCLR